jgi:hypothetical protein
MKGKVTGVDLEEKNFAQIGPSRSNISKQKQKLVEKVEWNQLVEILIRSLWPLTLNSLNPKIVKY